MAPPCCRVCNEHYVPCERVPRSLGCGHTFCTICLTKMKETSGVLKCPTCRAVHPHADVDNLTVNYDLMSTSVSSFAKSDTSTSAAPEGYIAVVVKDLMDQQFRLQVKPSMTVLEVKKILEAKYGIMPDHTRLLFRGRKIDDNRTLSFYKIRTGNIIQMSTGYLGGGGGGR
ncbi:uncharacterized protein [Panulirus ornatus]|uniref:uncharacterized protein n=1 Tax=Panulirus ornatus TaxID=150431 RepID=UPI003A87BD5A